MHHMQNHVNRKDLRHSDMNKNIAHFKRQPPRGALVRYDERVAEVLGGARGNRVMIRSIHADGTTRISAVKWRNLKPLEASLF